MTTSHDPKRFKFGGPATYRIVIQGVLDPAYSSRLAGMTIKNVERNAVVLQTVLLGSLRDQAELRGVLETIYGLHLPVIKVEKVDND